MPCLSKQMATECDLRQLDLASLNRGVEFAEGSCFFVLKVFVAIQSMEAVGWLSELITSAVQIRLSALE